MRASTREMTSHELKLDLEMDSEMDCNETSGAEETNTVTDLEDMPKSWVLNQSLQLPDLMDQ